MKIKVVETIPEDGGGAGKTFTIERVRKEGLPQRARIGDPADAGEGSAADGRVLQQQLEDAMNLGIGGDDLQLNDPTAGEVSQALGLVAPNKLVNLDQYGIPGLLGEVHRHTLEESDRIKKSTVEREGIKRQKEMKKVQVRFYLQLMPSIFRLLDFFLLCLSDVVARTPPNVIPQGRYYSLCRLGFNAHFLIIGSYLSFDSLQ